MLRITPDYLALVWIGVGSARCADLGRRSAASLPWRTRDARRRARVRGGVEGGGPGGVRWPINIGQNACLETSGWCQVRALEASGGKKFQVPYKFRELWRASQSKRIEPCG